MRPENPCERTRTTLRARPLTDLYLAAVERAVARPGTWTDVRVFDTEFNARMGAICLAGGYLRVQPRPGDTPILVAGKRCISTAAPVETKLDEGPHGWLLKIRTCP